MQDNIFLALGSNKGDRLSYLNNALIELENNGIKVIKKSSILETKAYGVENQDNFLNMAIQISCDLSPENLLITIKNIEKKVGRTPSFKWGPREIDIDIIYYNNLILNKTIEKNFQLIIPHPDLHNRNFVLIPLTEIAPNFIHPVLQKTNSALLESLNTTF
ncbi:MAG TPA: 2-amino-4-hydroxy-6-hydroxymethyldihydropteridine diphosphokinase [Ignavibacteriales bacterium]|nr:2-amino-4-hydroxy-6-hydroxymethyldihydropteridine diphosphokinase [Ignavibacteriales bacterium]HOL82134.1 2-amino-4-hydroxy-6-hydroxymethyldihydropteridine diphosphokinase [Ignavibacteriales bacterium]HOM65779.1 2-amino-4-hydroxy-6-hydroxymethyldihydropteridine diphosphokinase [Ignavibacteriales bacterium]HPP34262.1 2-amino-4-hydroxy-6-hydroxymethyldihydropteridine diphosphokinase [Ignavibacteriales bacterium]HRR19361.1 2-amino-4-hydroxy-6-hydroxymethyldihydropteridine diphosphokinase [Ignav